MGPRECAVVVRCGCVIVGVFVFGCVFVIVYCVFVIVFVVVFVTVCLW